MLSSKSDSARPTAAAAAAAAAGPTCLGYKYQQSAAQIPFPQHVITSFPYPSGNYFYPPHPWSLVNTFQVGDDNILYHPHITNIAWKDGPRFALDAEIGPFAPPRPTGAKFALKMHRKFVNKV